MAKVNFKIEIFIKKLNIKFKFLFLAQLHQ